jgi:hypothetical protein
MGEDLKNTVKIKMGLIIIGVFIFAIFPMAVDVLVTKIKGWLDNE